MNSNLKVVNLTKSFKNFTAVDAVSFEARAGEIFGLLGPNGAGKTTTIRTIATVLAPTSGTAEVCGFDIVRQPEEVKKHLGVLTTEIGVYERFSGRENLRYFGRLFGLEGEKLEQRINELSELLQMTPFIDRKAGKYSTGMKQKLAIARSVIHDPEVIIFDEPTAGLDVLASQTVLRFMQQARTLGKCIVLSTHEMTDAEKLCDRVAIIHQSKIVTVDTVKALEQKTGTTNLEDAFMKLVDGSAASTAETNKQKEKPKTSQTRRFRRMLALVMFGLVLGYFVLSFVPALANWRSAGFGCLGVAIALWVFDRGVLKRMERR